MELVCAGRFTGRGKPNKSVADAIAAGAAAVPNYAVLLSSASSDDSSSRYSAHLSISGETGEVL